jgi:hypothetical protein
VFDKYIVRKNIVLGINLRNQLIYEIRLHRIQNFQIKKKDLPKIDDDFANNNCSRQYAVMKCKKYSFSLSYLPPAPKNQGLGLKQNERIVTQ